MLKSEKTKANKLEDISYILQKAQCSYENYMIKSDSKFLDEAISFYEKALATNSSTAEAHYKLASLLWEKGDIDIRSALNKCRQAIEISPYNATARLHLGYFLKTSGKYDEAEKEFRKAINLNHRLSSKPRIALAQTIIKRMNSNRKKPTIIELCKSCYYFLSGTIMLLWDYKTLNLMCKSCSSNIDFNSYKLKGEFYYKTGNLRKATQILHLAALKTEREPYFYKKIADMALKSKNYHIALDYYRDALSYDKENTEILAKLCFLIQNYFKDFSAELKGYYLRLSKLDSSNARVLYELGHLNLKEKDKFSAVDCFKKALNIDMHNPFYHNSLAYALVQLEDYDGAIKEYQKAIRLNPDNEWTSVISQALGTMYYQVKENEEAAILSYQTSVLLDPNNFDAYVALGELYQEVENYSAAIEVYLDALKLNSTDADVYSNLGLCMWEEDYIDEAIIAYQKAIMFKPDYEVLYNNLGIIYLEGANLPESAFKMFSSAIGCNPNYVLGYYNKARSLEQLEQPKEAAEFYQMALDINSFTEEMSENVIKEKIYNIFKIS